MSQSSLGVRYDKKRLDFARGEHSVHETFQIRCAKNNDVYSSVWFFFADHPWVQSYVMPWITPERHHLFLQSGFDSEFNAIEVLKMVLVYGSFPEIPQVTSVERQRSSA